jgi:hypothetical protein
MKTITRPWIVIEENPSLSIQDNIDHAFMCSVRADCTCWLATSFGGVFLDWWDLPLMVRQKWFGLVCAAGVYEAQKIKEGHSGKEPKSCWCYRGAMGNRSSLVRAILSALWKFWRLMKDVYVSASALHGR